MQEKNINSLEEGWKRPVFLEIIFKDSVFPKHYRNNLVISIAIPELIFKACLKISKIEKAQ